MDKTEIAYNDPNAARFVENISGWIDVNGRFFGNAPDSEHNARFSSCTNDKCKCGNPKSKYWKNCEDCRSKEEVESYNKLPFREYDGSLVYSRYADMYFQDEDEIFDYCEEEGVDAKDLMLVFCEPNKYRHIREDYWCDDMPEDSDGSLPKELQDALDNLNKVISGLPPVSYSPGNVRTEVC